MDAISALTNVLAAFGLAGSAGLNAYVPLLVVSLVGRYTPWLKLEPPWSALTDGWVIAVLGVLVVVEFIADKVPAVNHANDAVQTFIRPAAGAILFAASTGVVSEMNPALAIVLGVLTAGAVHTAKSAVVRPVVTATTAGVANPVVSTIEDVLALVTSIVAVLLPALAAILLVLVLAIIFVWVLRRNSGPARSRPR
jgi:hypothetical protein